MTGNSVTVQSDQAAADEALVSLSLGPRPDWASLAWRRLSEFPSWPAWCIDIRSLVQLDSGQTGRGSKLQIDYRGQQQVWEIIYWEPQRRLDFEIMIRGLRCGFSFRLTDSDRQNCAGLQLFAEFINTGAALPAYFRRRKMIRLAKVFMRDFSRKLSSTDSPSE